MQLEEVVIKNFLSIKGPLKINFNNLTVFVGPNNHGKTNILKALDFFFNGTTLAWNDLVTNGINEDITVICGFSNASKFIPLLNPKHQDKHRKYLVDGDKIFFERKYIKNGTKPENFKVFSIEDNQSKDITGITNANTMMPKFEYIPTKMTIDDTAKIQKNNYLGKMLFDIFDRVTPEEDKQYLTYWQKIEEYFNNRDDENAIKEVKEIEEMIFENLKKSFPECENVQLKINLPKIDEIIKGFRIKINDGQSTDVSFKGDGMQRATVLSIIKSYVDFQKRNFSSDEEKDKLKNKLPIIFAIDEAELHLHPASQRDLLETLDLISSFGDKVIFTTHSGVMVKSGKEKVIYNIKKENGYTKKIDKSKMGILELLGSVPSDFEFPDNIIIVEGESDKKFLEKIIGLLNIEKRINIHFSGGDSKIVNAGEAINQMLRTCFYIPFYKESICAVFDKQSNMRNIDDFKKYICKNDNSRILELDKNGIEYYYPKSILKSFFNEEKDDKELEKAISEFILLTKESSDKKAVFGNIGEVSKRDFADRVNNLLVVGHLLEIDENIKLLIKKAESLSY